MNIQNINLRGPFCNTGYGVVCRNLLKALEKAKYNPTFIPIGQPRPNNEDENILLHNCLNRRHFFDYNAISLNVWHQHDIALKVGNGPNCALPFFELDRLQPHEIHHLQSLDIVWAASQWAKDVLLDSDIDCDKIFMQPMGVNTDIFKPIEIKEKDNNKYIFLNIGKIEYRKGHDFLHTMFAKAFDNNKNVELWMMWSNPFLKPKEVEEWERMYKDVLGDRVKFISPVKTDNEVAQIISLSDTGIFPTRAEGFNLPALEMMACGKNLITTNYSSMTEYCNKDNSYLTEVNSFKWATDGIWFNSKEGKWAEMGRSQQDQFIEYMRFCYKNRPDNKPGVETAKSLTWDNVVRNFVEYLKNLANLANSPEKVLTNAENGV